MVAKIYTGQTPEEEIGQEFREEVAEMLKQVAHDNKCDVNELKFTVNNDGVVNIQRMTPQEMIDEEAKRVRQRKVNLIKKARGV
jgi:hypothetical protein